MTWALLCNCAFNYLYANMRCVDVYRFLKLFDRLNVFMNGELAISDFLNAAI